MTTLLCKPITMHRFVSGLASKARYSISLSLSLENPLCHNFHIYSSGFLLFISVFFFFLVCRLAKNGTQTVGFLLLSPIQFFKTICSRFYVNFFVILVWSIVF